MKKEIRQLDAAELRAEKTENGYTIRGYAAVFDKKSLDLGGFREIIQRGAFANALASKDLDCVALLNHDNNMLFARSSSGTLSLKEDENGLLSEWTMPDTQLGKDTAKLVERGDISKMSFGFYINKDHWEERDGEYTRTVLDVSKLVDVSLVTRPAYPDTSAALRSMDAFKEVQTPTNKRPYKAILTIHENSLK